MAEGYVEHNPLDGIVFKPPKDPPIEPYQREHKEKFLAVLNHDWEVARTPRQRMLAARDKAITCLFLESGLRLQELADLCLGDIDLDKHRVKVWFGKLGKSRLSGFGPQTRKALWRYLSLRPVNIDGDRLWVTEEGRPLSSRGIQEIFRNGREAQVIVENWRQEYNNYRPHSSLDYLTPSEFARRYYEKNQVTEVKQQAEKAGSLSL